MAHEYTRLSDDDAWASEGSSPGHDDPLLIRRDKSCWPACTCAPRAPISLSTHRAAGRPTDDDSSDACIEANTHHRDARTHLRVRNWVPSGRRASDREICRLYDKLWRWCHAELSADFDELETARSIDRSLSLYFVFLCTQPRLMYGIIHHQ